MKKYGTQIKRWRSFKGISQSQLAIQSGIPRPNLAAIENNRRDFTVGTLVQLADAFGILPGQVLDQDPFADIRFNRHDIDSIARAALGYKVNVPPIYKTVVASIAWQIYPIARASGHKITFKETKKTKPIFLGKKILSLIVARVNKIAASGIHNE